MLYHGRDIPNYSRVIHTMAAMIWLLRFTVMILNFLTDRSWQTVQTQIRLLQEEQSDQGLYCLLFHLHGFDEIPFKFGLFVRILGILQQRFLASENLGTLW